MKIYVKKIEGVTLPEKGSQVAAGYDIVATSEPKVIGVQIEHEFKRIDYVEYETNLYIAPDSTLVHTLIHPRSSVSKYNLVLANSIGLIDNDYRGMVLCRFKYIWQPEDVSISGNVLRVRPNPEKMYKKGDKIAQLVVEQTVGVEWVFVDNLDQTQRGTGGFGSTDDKTGKPIEQVFAEEKKKFEERQPQSASPILDKYKEAGGLPTRIPYSEVIKKRQSGIE